MTRGSRISPEKRQQILDLFDQDTSVTPAMISTELDVAMPTVYRILRNADRDVLRSANRSTLTPQDQAALIEGFLIGVPGVQLRTDFDISTSEYYTLLRQAGVDFKATRRKRQETRHQKLDKAIAMYQEGHPLWSITLETGISAPVVNLELHKRRMQLRRGSKKQETAIIQDNAAELDSMQRDTENALTLTLQPTGGVE